MTTKQQPYRDPEVLRRLYWSEGLDIHQIAERYGVHQKTIWRWFEKYNIDRREASRAGSTQRGTRYQKFTPYGVDHQGYEVWSGSTAVDGFSTTFVHQLLAVADGADPYKVYGGCAYQIHHKNGVKWDNRPGNVELLTAKEHAAKHPERGSDPEYTNQELLSWIESFVEEVGHVPSRKEMNECPGPHSLTIAKRFGSWSTALEKCGYEPRDGAELGAMSKHGYRVSDKTDEDGESRVRKNNPDGMSKGEYDMSGECPLCGDMYTGGLPNHLPCEGGE